MPPLREFADCRERIARAKVHAKALAKAWSRFLEDEPYAPRLRVEDDGTGTLWVEPAHGLPRHLALELGELLYQLRAALDGLVYGAAILETGEDPPPNHQQLEFPICASAADFKNARRKLGPLAEERRAIIETIQPYNAVEGLRPEIVVFSPHRALGILNDWARKDRHRA
ncbi:hypothetical protein LCGC14_2749070, partial [marine sediment metagenome]